MDNILWIIYFIDVILEQSFIFSTGDWVGLSFLIGGISFVGWGMFKYLDTGMSADEEKEAWDKDRPMLYGLLKTWIKLTLLVYVLNLAGSLIPNKDTAYKMLAAYGVLELSKTEEVRALGAKSMAVLEKAMSSYLEEQPTAEE